MEFSPAKMRSCYQQCKPSKTEAAPSKIESKLETADKIKDFKGLGSWVNMEVTSVEKNHWGFTKRKRRPNTARMEVLPSKILDLTQQKSWFKAFDNIKNGGFRNAKWV